MRGPIEAAAAELTGPRPSAGIAVAGTPTSLAAVELEPRPLRPERVHGHVLTLPAIQRLLSRLASAPLAERREIAGLHPDRAPTIVAGVVILVETMRAFGLDQIEVSEHDILYGAAIPPRPPTEPDRRSADPIGQIDRLKRYRWSHKAVEPSKLGTVSLRFMSRRFDAP